MIERIMTHDEVDFVLLVSALSIAVIIGYMLAVLLRKSSEATEKKQFLWSITTAVIFGVAIWFIQILSIFAFHPWLSYQISIPYLVLSLFISISTCGFSVYIVINRELNIVRWLLTGAVIGLGFSSVQYLIYESLYSSSNVYFDGFLVAIGSILGIIIGLSIQIVAYRGLIHKNVHRRTERIMNSIILGMAFILMHYIGHLSFEDVQTSNVSPLIMGMNLSHVDLAFPMIFSSLFLGLSAYLLKEGKKRKARSHLLHLTQSSTVLVLAVGVETILFLMWMVSVTYHEELTMLRVNEEIHSKAVNVYLNYINHETFDIEKVKKDSYIQVKSLNKLVVLARDGGVVNSKILRKSRDKKTLNQLNELAKKIKLWGKNIQSQLEKKSKKSFGGDFINVKEDFSAIITLSEQLSKTIHTKIFIQLRAVEIIGTILLLVMAGVLYGLYISSKRHKALSNAQNNALKDMLSDLEIQQLALNTHAIVSIADASGSIVHANSKFSEVSQYPINELIGRNHNILNSGYHASEFFRDMWRMIKKGDVWQGEIKNRRKDGSFYWVDTTIVPVLGKNGKPVEYISIRTDITKIKKTEEELAKLNIELEGRVGAKIAQLQDAQEQLLQSEKMASIGQLAAGVAHEINNPVGYINSNIGSLKHYITDLFDIITVYEMAENSISDPLVLETVTSAKHKADLSFLKEDISSLIMESEEGIQRVKQIVQDLKDFSHVDEAEWQWADLHHGIDSTLNIVWNEIKYKAEVIKEYGVIPEIECIPSQLNQVFLNLLVNAAHAIDDRGTITISTGIIDNTEVWVEISDTGSGIPEDKLNKIFEPFFTTKPVGTGTGLGLSLSFGIIEKHGGSMKVTSETGKGTTFRIVLPVEHTDTDVII